MIRTASLAAAAIVAMTVTAMGQASVERGRYLVTTVMTCHNCHTPAGPNGLVLEREFSGGPQVFDTPAFTVRGANITPDKATGIGDWSAADLKKALVDGVRPNGIPLAPIMPSAFYKVITASDLESITMYLKSLKPISNAVPPPTYKAPFQHDHVPGGDKQMTQADLQDKMKNGFYMVTIAHCLECHTPMTQGRRDFSRMGAGGEEFKGPWGVTTARNITSHKEKGIGAWSDADVKKAITQGIRPDGTRLKPPMGFPMYARMTDADLDAMVAWVRTLPAKE